MMSELIKRFLSPPLKIFSTSKLPTQFLQFLLLVAMLAQVTDALAVPSTKFGNATVHSDNFSELVANGTIYITGVVAGETVYNSRNVTVHSEVSQRNDFAVQCNVPGTLPCPVGPIKAVVNGLADMSPGQAAGGCPVPAKGQAILAYMNLLANSPGGGGCAFFEVTNTSPEQFSSNCNFFSAWGLTLVAQCSGDEVSCQQSFGDLTIKVGRFEGFCETMKMETSGVEFLHQFFTNQ